MSRKRALKIDFHVHSNFSNDGDMPPEEIVETAKKIGLDGIAVTDHNTIKGGEEAEKLAGKNLLVFVGSEIKTQEGEIIGLNLKEDVPEGLTPEETCRLIKAQAGLVILPHPFDKLRKGLGKSINDIIQYIDAVEVFNSRTLVDRFNKESLDFAKKHKIPGIAGSDSHFGVEIGSAYTVVDSEMKKDSVIKAVLKGKTKVVGGKSGVMPHWKTFVTKMGKKLK